MGDDEDSWSGGELYEAYPVDPVAQLRPRDRHRSRLAVFAYSRPNKVGLFLAGLALFVGLLAGPGAWLLPTMFTFWLIGVVITPRDIVDDVVIDSRGSAPDIRTQLDALLETSRRRLPQELFALVASICHSIELILPRTAGGGVPAGSAALYDVHQTVLRYLPDALNAYFALPPGYAHRHHIAGGKTPDEVLGDQLALLDREMHAIVGSLAEHDADRLVASGRFLQERFGGEQRRALDLPPGDPPPPAGPTPSS